MATYELRISANEATHVLETAQAKLNHDQMGNGLYEDEPFIDPEHLLNTVRDALHECFPRPA